MIFCFSVSTFFAGTYPQGLMSLWDVVRLLVKFDWVEKYLEADAD